MFFFLFSNQHIFLVILRLNIDEWVKVFKSMITHVFRKTVTRRKIREVRDA